MQPPPLLPPSPFLQKFIGKQQKINKEGLLQLFGAAKSPSRDINDAQRRKKVSIISKRGSNQLEQYASSILKPDTPLNSSPKIQKNKFSSQQLKVSKSERALDAMAFHLSKRNDSKPFLQEQFKLPPISRSNSQNSNLLSKNSVTPNVQMIQSDRSHRKKQSSGSFYSKNSDRASRQIQLDEYVLKHMQFLHKFQKQLISNRLSHGSKSFKQ